MLGISRITGLYERLSRDDEIYSESNSIASQKAMLENYADKKELSNIQNYTDDGYSVTNFNRLSFMRMISDIKAIKVDTIIVKDLSRIGRNYFQVGMYTEVMFSKYGIRFIAIK